MAPKNRKNRGRSHPANDSSPAPAQHLAPDDWDAWRVLADQLWEDDDGLAMLLQMTHSQLTESITPDEDASMGEYISEQIANWLEAHGSRFGKQERTSLEWYIIWKRSFSAIASVAPLPVCAAMAWSEAQVLAAMTQDNEFATTRVKALELAVMDWIEAAFDGVPPPGLENLTMRQAEGADNHEHVPRTAQDSYGPWQQITEEYILESQWALSHLDAIGLRYYLPVVMRFTIKHLRAPHPGDKWITESLSYTLERSSYQRSAKLYLYQRRRLGALTQGQRAAIAGFCWLTQNEACSGWAEGAQLGADWIDHFQAGFAGEK